MLRFSVALPRCGNVDSQHTEEMDGAKFAKLCRDSKLLSRTVTASDADLFFAKVCPSHLISSKSPLQLILRAFL